MAFDLGRERDGSGPLNWGGADVRCGSRLCENAKAINRDRTSYSFKTVSCAYIGSAFNFEIEIKNIILVALRTFEFSHGVGQKRKWRRFQVMSALPHKADIDVRDCDVRFVPTADSCTATN